jgi:hypothetical protein
MHDQWRFAKWARLGGLLGAGVVLGLLVLPNLATLGEGWLYLRQARAWQPQAVTPLASAGPDAVIWELARADNRGREEIIRQRLGALGLTPRLLPIEGEERPNILLTWGDAGPYTLWVAHYDKMPDDPAFPAAADNTAALGVLLAVAQEWATNPPRRPTAFLLTAAEERGAIGAASFVRWAQETAFPLREVISLDMLGRGHLAARPAASAGLYFWLPLAGQLVYDGRAVQRASAYALPDAALVERLRAVAGEELVVYRRFAVAGDANVFQQTGLPTVTLSSADIYYLNLVWQRDTDRVELLDARHLDVARRLLREYAMLP